MNNTEWESLNKFFTFKYANKKKSVLYVYDYKVRIAFTH